MNKFDVVFFSGILASVIGLVILLLLVFIN